MHGREGYRERAQQFVVFQFDPEQAAQERDKYHKIGADAQKLDDIEKRHFSSERSDIRDHVPSGSMPLREGRFSGR
jgi:hypothetical protein